MAHLLTNQGPSLENITAEERQLLLRYCVRVTSDIHIAEDLVQQTLLEAWQHATRIATPDLRGPWLFGVARNICLRWQRSHGRETARQVRLAPADDSSARPQETDLLDNADPLAEIERSDLVTLLDQALSLLPPTTRQALVGRYIEDLSQAALACRLGVSEGAVEARLQRGKRALRDLLTTRFRDQIAAYGVDAPVHDGWEPTRIWCAVCGQHRLMVRRPAPPGVMAFRCPGCDPVAPKAEYRLANPHFAQLIGRLSQPRAILNRVAAWIYPYFRQGLEAGEVTCTNCGRRVRLNTEPPPESATNCGAAYRMLAVCPLCQEAVSVSFRGLVEALPAVQRLWQQQGRIRTLPIYEVEAEGQAALVTRFASVTTAAGLTIVVARDPFRLLHVVGDPATQADL